MKTKQFKFNYEEGYEYVPTPFDEKNLTTDWLTDFFFDNKAVEADERNVIAGYGNIPCQSEELVIVEWGNNVATWKFIERNYLDDEDVTDFCNDLNEYLKDDSTPRAFTATIKIGSGINESETTYYNQITIIFHAKVE